MDTKANAWMTSGEGHPRRWAILAVLVVSLLVVVLDNTVLNIALPTIQGDLDATQSELVWAIDSYILVFASLLFTWGILGDKYGRKKVLIIGLVIFVSRRRPARSRRRPGMLIAFRALMGVGGAAVLPTTLAIITVVFPPHERGKAIGAWAGAVGAAVALGPVLGGILLEHPEWSSWLTGNDWGSVFLINLPIVVVGLFFIWRVVPETRNPHPRKLDLAGLALSATGLVLLVYGIIEASATKDWLAPSVIYPIIAGILMIALFLWMEARSDHPSFDVSLFRNRGYAVSLTAVSLAFFALSGITFTLPFYLQILRGYTTLAAGLCFLPFAVGQLIAAPRSAAMVKRFGYRTVMTVGLVHGGRLDAAAGAHLDRQPAVGRAARVLHLRLRHGQRHRPRVDRAAERAAAGPGRRGIGRAEHRPPGGRRAWRGGRRHGARDAVRGQPHHRDRPGARAVPRRGEAGGHRVDRRRGPDPRRRRPHRASRTASSSRCASVRSRPSSAPRT